MTSFSRVDIKNVVFRRLQQKHHTSCCSAPKPTWNKVVIQCSNHYNMKYEYDIGWTSISDWLWNEFGYLKDVILISTSGLFALQRKNWKFCFLHFVFCQKMELQLNLAFNFRMLLLISQNIMSFSNLNNTQHNGKYLIWNEFLSNIWN